MADWYKWYSGDYLRDTRLLTLEEHGAYRLLIDHYMTTEQPIPNDPYKVRRILGVSVQKTRKILAVLSQFFVEKNGFFYHKKCEEMLDKYLKTSEKQRANAHARWHAKSMPPETRNQKPDNIYVDTNVSTLSDSQNPPKKKANGIPYQKIIDTYHECMPDNPRVAVVSDKRKGHIRTIVRKHEMTTIEDWKNYFSFCNQSKFLTGAVPPTPGRKQFVADIDWLINENNFIKVAEKKYHENQR